jgi:hypothetical protein
MEPKTNKWTIEYLEEDKIVVQKNLEALNWEETKELAKLVVAAMRQHNTNRLLIEHCGDIKLSVLEIDGLPAFIKDLDIRKKDRVAIFYDSSSPYKSLLTFLKNVLILTSHKLQLFTDKNKAIAWLKSGD